MTGYFRSLGLSALQVRVIALCILINMMDGFDIMAMAYVAPRISGEWGLSPTELGALLSAGLAGMVVGSMSAGTVADKIGRRPVILTCLAIAAIGSGLCAIAGDRAELAGGRFVTGLAVGGMLPCINTMVAEYASARSRALAVALMQGGFTIGAALGGFIAAAMISRFGWQAVFASGAVLTAALIPLVALKLPESLAYLEGRPGRQGERSTLLAQCDGLSDVPAQSSINDDPAGLRDYIAVGWPLLTVFAVFFLSVMGFYFNTSWVPKLFTDRGLTQTTSVLAGSLLTAGGLIAAIALGWLSLRRQIAPLVAMFALAAAGMSAVIGQMQAEAIPLLIAAFVLGICINATQIGTYAIVPALFPAKVRAGATGIAVGVGRLGAVLSPWLAGALLAEGWSAGMLFVLMAVPYALAAILLFPMQRWMTH